MIDATDCVLLPRSDGHGLREHVRVECACGAVRYLAWTNALKALPPHRCKPCSARDNWRHYLAPRKLQ